MNRPRFLVAVDGQNVALVRHRQTCEAAAGDDNLADPFATLKVPDVDVDLIHLLVVHLPVRPKCDLLRRSALSRYQPRTAERKFQTMSMALRQLDLARLPPRLH